MTDDAPDSPDASDEADLIRRSFAPALAALCLMPEAALAQDPVRVQPPSYRVVLENEKVRVLEYTSHPGIGVCGGGIHSHPPHVTVLLTPARVRVVQNGRTVVLDQKAGDAFYEPAVTHEVENVGHGDVRALIIELKTPTGPHR